MIVMTIRKNVENDKLNLNAMRPRDIRQASSVTTTFAGSTCISNRATDATFDSVLQPPRGIPLETTVVRSPFEIPVCEYATPP